MFIQGTYYKFGRSVFLFNLAHRLLPALLIAVAVILGQFILPISSAVGFLLLAIFVYAIIMVLSVWYSYAYHSFKIDEFALVIRSGLINQREISIPYHHIENVDMSQSYGERMFHISELTVHTMGDAAVAVSTSSTTTFPHIDHAYAVELSRELVKRAGIEEVVEEKTK